MSEKKEIKISLGTIICIFIIILLLLVIGGIYYYYNFINTNKINSNNIIINNKQISTKNTSKQDIEVLKKALKNEEWIKENIYIKNDCFGQKIINSEIQKITFEILNTDNNKAPVVIIQTIVENKSSVQLFIVTCINSVVKCEKIDEVTSHSGHVVFKVSEDKIVKEYAHMGNYEYYVYKIENEMKKLIDSKEGELGNTEEEYVELYNIEEKYNLSAIDNELTNVNIEKYIK